VRQAPWQAARSAERGSAFFCARTCAKGEGLVVWSFWKDLKKRRRHREDEELLRSRHGTKGPWNRGLIALITKPGNAFLASR
jgi:hypothetical protein